MKGLKQECCLRLRKGRTSALKGDLEKAIRGKQKDSVRKEMLAVSATTIVRVEKWHNRPLLHQDRKRKTTEEVPRKETPPTGSSPSGRYWRPPVCQYYKSASGRELGDKCSLRHTEVDSQPGKNSRRKVVGKDR